MGTFIPLWCTFFIMLLNVTQHSAFISSISPPYCHCVAMTAPSAQCPDRDSVNAYGAWHGFYGRYGIMPSERDEASGER